MKILLSVPNYSSYYPGLRRALTYLKIDWINFDYRQLTIFEKLIALVLGQKIAYQLLNRRLIKLANSYQPDIFLAVKGERIDEVTLRHIKDMRTKTVNWFPDHVDSLLLAAKLSQAYDFFFHFDPYAIAQLKKIGRKNIHYLPFAADILPTDPLPLLTVSQQYPLSFIGNYNTRREKYLQKIADLGLTIWGDKRWAQSSLRNHYQGYLQHDKLALILERSKISLNIQHDYSSQGAVLRVFEVTGSGTMLLSEYRKDIPHLFQVEKEVDMFNGPEELRIKALFYLAHQKKRVGITKLGYLAAKNKHTYVHRIRDILSLTT